jgi:ABC-type multidrug transport system ATPase subunit
MELTLVQIGKRFNFNWLFRNFSHTFLSGSRTVILGSNGSGKSTLLQILAGYGSVSEGEISWKYNDESIVPENLYAHISLATPYLELIEDFTLREHIAFHFKLKSVRNGLSTNQILEHSGLSDKADTRIAYFSSGMKQRVRLLLAILSETPLLLLDEPTSNLDKSAIVWYHKLVEQFGDKRTIVVCSNSIPDEYAFCNAQIDLSSL